MIPHKPSFSKFVVVATATDISSGTEKVSVSDPSSASKRLSVFVRFVSDLLSSR